jgi:hypothetical protein
VEDYPMPNDPAVEAAQAGRYVATKRGTRKKQRGHGRQQRGGDDDADEADAYPEADAYNIRAFCKRHDISEQFYWKLHAAGLGPAIMKVGARTLISREAAAAWRAERTAAAATK